MSDSQIAALPAAEDERLDEEGQRLNEEGQQASELVLEKQQDQLSDEEGQQASELVLEEKSASVEALAAEQIQETVDSLQEAPEERLQEVPEEQFQEVLEEQLREAPVDKLEAKVADEPGVDYAPEIKRGAGTRSLLLTLVLLLFLGSSSALLVHDLSDSYLYVYTLNSNNGNMLNQENLGGQQDWISAPVLQQGQIKIGTQKKSADQRYQLLSLKRQANTIKLEGSQTIEQSQPVIHVANTGELVSVGEQGLQVRQADGKLLWQRAADLHIQGVHRFQPVSDENTIYSIKATTPGEIVAYDRKDGTERWTQELHESLNYAPPLLLEQGTLYIAGEKKLYALESGSGQVLWQAPIAGRSLEKNQGMDILLVAAAQGLIALSPETGMTLWTFNGQNDEHLTSPQFYQASLTEQTIQGAVLYATGIRWRLPEIEQQTWLYAIDATSGKPLWSQQLGAGFISGDSGRIFPPLIDQRGQSVIIQHQESLDEEQISAYDLKTGVLRWTSTIQGVQGSAPGLLQLPDGTLFLFAVTDNWITALATLPLGHYLLLLAALLSLSGLILLWAVLLRRARERRRAIFTDLQYRQTAPERYRKRHASHLLKEPVVKFVWQRVLIGFGLILLLLGTIFLEYRQFNEGKTGIYQVDAGNGEIQWQQTDQQGVLEGIDSAGSISVQQQRSLQWLQANTAGGSQWESFASEGVFRLATNQTSTETLVASLTSNERLNYQFAPVDPGYPNTLADLFILTGFARADGQLRWQTTVSGPQEHRKLEVLGADQRYVYVSSTPDQEVSDQAATVQLLAVNQQSGNIDWRIYGPSGGFSKESLSLLNTHLIWGVQGRVYLLDTNSGQIEWQRILPGTTGNELQIQQMAVTESGKLLLATQEYLYSFEQSNGTLLWSEPLISSMHVHILTVGESVLVAGEKQIQAYNAANAQPLWSRQLDGTLQSIGSDGMGKAIYLSVQESGKRGVVRVLALESGQGRALWNTVLAEQTEEAEIVESEQGRLLLSVCEGVGGQSCGGKRLYMFDGMQGRVLWKTESRTISKLSIDPTGNSIVFQSR